MNRYNLLYAHSPSRTDWYVFNLNLNISSDWIRGQNNPAVQHPLLSWREHGGSTEEMLEWQQQGNELTKCHMNKLLITSSK